MSSSPRTRVARKAPVKKKEPFALQRALPSFFKPSAMDLVLFSRQLAVFLRAGVPLVPAVEALGVQASNPTLRGALFLVRDDLIGGDPISNAIGRRPCYFTSCFV